MSRVCHLKDLTKLNRSLQRTLIVDNFAENFTRQKENGIHIKGWYGDTKDRVLQTLESILLDMAKIRPNDIREYLRIMFSSNKYEGLSMYL